MSIANRSYWIGVTILFLTLFLPCGLFIAVCSRIIENHDSLTTLHCVLAIPFIISMIVVIFFAIERHKRIAINTAIRLSIFGKEDFKPDYLPTYAEGYEFFNIKHLDEFSDKSLLIYYHMYAFDRSYQEKVISNYAYIYALNESNYDYYDKFYEIEDTYHVCSKYITKEEKTSMRNEAIKEIEYCRDGSLNLAESAFKRAYGKKLANSYLNGLKKDYNEFAQKKGLHLID